MFRRSIGIRGSIFIFSGKAYLIILFPVFGLCILSNVLLFSHAAYACRPIAHTTNSQVVSMTLPSQIYRRWVHSHEEDEGDILVYRPSDYPFPPARGREGLEFRENGEFIRYQIGPTDRSLAIPGQWIVKGANTVEVKFPEEQSSPYILTILECNEQVLKIRQTAEDY